MAWGARRYLVGTGVLGVLGVLAGCGVGNIFADREPWRQEAEAQCINAGAVKEGAGVVRINTIRGPGICGVDLPLQVSALGEGSTFGYSDEPRPPGEIPGAAPQPRWPVRAPPARLPPRASGGEVDGPVSLSPPATGNPHGDGANPYDFRRPYGGVPPAAAPARSTNHRDASPPVLDLSPVPYERRRVIDAARAEQSTGSARPPLRAEPLPPTDISRAPLRETPPPLGPARGVPVTGAIAAVSMNPPATLACPMVSALEQWIANDVQPAALRWFGAPVAEIKQISAYSCRGMNNQPGARISEHAFGNALDIAAFTLADGRRITVKNGWNGLPEEQGFLRDVQGSACGQFNTVLAPGSNIYHYDHIHVDLMRRRNGRTCNPGAVAGDVVAARAGDNRYAGRRPGEPAVTGTLAQRSQTASQKRWGPELSDAEGRIRALPMAEPGNDGADDD